MLVNIQSIRLLRKVIRPNDSPSLGIFIFFLAKK
jgi:hypothetical protein